MNSDLYNNVYRIPDEILNSISIHLQKYRTINTNGKKRAKNILKNKSLTYQNLKRIKNYFDHIQGDYDIIEYNLNGGDEMKDFINNLLDRERNNLERSKSNKRNYGDLENQYNDTHEKTSLTNTQNNFLTTESVKISDEVKSISLGFLIKNREILLVKRADNDDWCPGLWALPGGGCENNELPEQTLIREIKEEIGLELINFKHKKTLVNKNLVEHLYLIMTKDLNVKLNHEHSDHKFFDIDYINTNKNEFVPNLLNYIKLMLN